MLNLTIKFDGIIFIQKPYIYLHPYYRNIKCKSKAGDPKIPFPVATTPRCRGGCYLPSLD